MSERLINLARDSGVAQIVVTRGGEVRLDEAFDAAPQEVYAVQKGVLAVLIGIAQEQYLCETHDAINHHLAPEWTTVGPWEEAKLTIEILMDMTTGMDDSLAPLGEIGKTWRYNNIAYQYLKRILNEHTGLTLQDLSDDWLFSKIGMNQTTWYDRETRMPDGAPLSGLRSTAGDLSRLGNAILEGGSAFTGDQWFLSQLGRPGSDENPAWGLLWWNNASPHFMVPNSEKRFDGPILPAAPNDLIAARGARGNHLSFSRDEQLVAAWTVIDDGEPNRRLERDLWEEIAKLR